MEQHRDGPAREPIQSSPLDQSYVGLMMERGEFPHLQSFLGTSFHHDAAFELGLKWLLDGIEHEYRGEWPSTTAPT